MSKIIIYSIEAKLFITKLSWNKKEECHWEIRMDVSHNLADFRNSKGCLRNTTTVLDGNFTYILD